jgi:hypothetical protein
MADQNPSEHRLPEDVDLWPTEARSLLGVGSDISRRDLKRAYARLIKLYKPEHAPEEFRRLREAYEELDRELEWRERFRLFQSQLSGDDADESTDSTAPDHQANDVQAGQAAPSTDVARISNPCASDESTDVRAVTQETSLDQLWQMALDGGDLDDVYRQFVDWSRRRIPREIDYARLYWLLTLKSDLDADRDPCTWVIEGLQRHGLAGRLITILDTDVRRRGGMVSHVLQPGFLDGFHESHRFVDLLETRWFAARRQGRFDLIGEDFQSFQRWFLDNPDQWLRLLSIGLKQVVLSHSAKMVNLFAQELAQIPSSSSASWIWDAVEAEMALHVAWSEAPGRFAKQFAYLSTFLSSVLNLIETTWEQSVAEARAAVLDFAKPIHDDPRAALNELVRVEQVSRPLVRRVLDLFELQLSESNVGSLSELTPGLDQELHRFVRQSFVRSNQASFDTNVLEFCLSEAVTTYDIEATLPRMTTDVPDEFFATAERLTSNLSLNCAILGNRLFW